MEPLIVKQGPYEPTKNVLVKTFHKKILPENYSYLGVDSLSNDFHNLDQGRAVRHFLYWLSFPPFSIEILKQLSIVSKYYKRERERDK